jgi:hypothetical protein
LNHSHQPPEWAAFFITETDCVGVLYCKIASEFSLSGAEANSGGERKTKKGLENLQ